MRKLQLYNDFKSFFVAAQFLFWNSSDDGDMSSGEEPLKPLKE